MEYYTGIGSRKIPGSELNFADSKPYAVLYQWGYMLGGLGLTLRSGAAHGADEAFETGCDEARGKKDIYLPWEHFNNSESTLHYIPPEAYEIAGDIYGPAWRYAQPATRKFMARNMMQVMGSYLDEPSSFVVCWTPDGCTSARSRTKETGGTGQAIAYADELGIPIFNLKNAADNDDLRSFILDHFKVTDNE